MGIENLEWLADLMNVELCDMLNGKINTDILKEVHPSDYDTVAKVNRIAKNSSKMAERLERQDIKRRGK